MGKTTDGFPPIMLLQVLYFNLNRKTQTLIAFIPESAYALPSVRGTVHHWAICATRRRGMLESDGEQYKNSSTWVARRLWGGVQDVRGTVYDGRDAHCVSLHSASKFLRH